MFNDAVLLKKEHGIATITMNRPEVNNAMNVDLMDGLRWAIQECFDESIRAVVLTGAGKAFCLGGDIASAVAYGGDDPQAFFRELTVTAARFISDVRLLPKPVIASVNGVCAGVGVSFATVCDLRIASTKAIFKQAYTSVGVSQDAGFTQFVPALIGLGRASEMVFLDEVITAEKALEWGLVNKVVAPESLAAETAMMAARLAGGATKAFASSKTLLNKALLPYLEVQMEAERQGVMAMSLTEDYQEGVAVFTGKKKKPEFKGR